MNKCIFSGRLVRDPELKTTNSGISVSSNCLAVKRKTRGENGEYGVDFIDFTVWRQSAEYLCNYGKKGDSAMIFGEMRIVKYEDKNGNAKSRTEIQAHEIELSPNKNSTANNTEYENSEHAQDYTRSSDDEDLPF